MVRLSNKAFAIIFPIKNIISKVSIEGFMNLLNLNEYSSESDFSNNSKKKLFQLIINKDFNYEKNQVENSLLASGDCKYLNIIEYHSLINPPAS